MQAPPSNAEDVLLTHLLRGLLPTGAVGAVRRVRPGDERCLTAAEAATLHAHGPAQRRACGAARALARGCARASAWSPPTWCGARTAYRCGHAMRSVRFRTTTFPQARWSVARTCCVALVWTSNMSSGPDEDLLGLVAGPLEISSVRATTHDLKTLSAIKEAVFKAVYPRDRMPLRFDDIMVDTPSRTATTCHGRRVTWRVSTHHRIIAVAWW